MTSLLPLFRVSNARVCARAADVLQCLVDCSETLMEGEDDDVVTWIRDRMQRTFELLGFP